MGNHAGARADLDRVIQLEPEKAWAVAERGALK